MSTDTETLVRTYFEVAGRPDLEPYVALFAPDAVVEDEARTRRGTDEIRAWRSGVPIVRHDIRAIGTAGDRTTARTTISGDFPGSPVDLTFAFTFDEAGLVETLTVRP